MGLLRRTRASAAPALAPDAAGPPIDLARFERLIEASAKVRDVGIDFEQIQRRATADAVSFNEALEAIDAELHA
jgi:hypothetical protein